MKKRLTIKADEDWEVLVRGREIIDERVNDVTCTIIDMSLTPDEVDKPSVSSALFSLCIFKSITYSSPVSVVHLFITASFTCDYIYVCKKLKRIQFKLVNLFRIQLSYVFVLSSFH